MSTSVEIVGSQKIKAGQSQVFQALLDPRVLKESVPGCSEAEYAEMPWAPEKGRQIRLIISPGFPGLNGPYEIFIKPEDLIEPSHLVLTSSPSSSVGSIDARCIVTLVDEGPETTINYLTTATLGGKIAVTPEFVIKTAVKGALDHFFKNLEKHIH
jgi:carbon monoxide dehydrogenase subunit G